MAGGFQITNLQRIWVETATAGTYATLNGQMKGMLSRKATKVDITTKDGANATTGAVSKIEQVMMLEYSLTLDGKIFFPDANFTLLEAAFVIGAPKNIQIRRNGAAGVSPGDVWWQAFMNIDDLSVDLSPNAMSTYTISLSLNAAPTINAVIV